jgi:hypothetical protein
LTVAFFSLWGVLDIVRIGEKLFAFDPLWWSTNAPHRNGAS